MASFTLFAVRLDRAADALAVDQERVVAVRRVELDVGDGRALLAQRARELALLPDREQQVRGDADHERGARDRLDRRMPARRVGEVEQVHRLRDVEIGVGVVLEAELLALVDEVALELEVLVEARRNALDGPRAAEAVLPLRPRAVGDRSHLPGDLLAAVRKASAVVAAVAPVGVGHHGLSLHEAKRDRLWMRWERCRNGEEESEAL